MGPLPSGALVVRKDSHLGEYCTDEENKSTHVCSGCYTKCHRLGGSNNRHLFLKVLEARESKVKIEAFISFSWLVYSCHFAGCSDDLFFVYEQR